MTNKCKENLRSRYQLHLVHLIGVIIGSFAGHFIEDWRWIVAIVSVLFAQTIIEYVIDEKVSCEK